LLDAAAEHHDPRCHSNSDSAITEDLVVVFVPRHLAQDLAVELDNALSAGREDIGSSRGAESLIVRERRCRGRPASFHRL